MMHSLLWLSLFSCTHPEQYESMTEVWRIFPILTFIWELLISLENRTRFPRSILIFIPFSFVEISQYCDPKFMIIFLCISQKICFGCSKEPSRRDGSFEHPQHMFCLRDKKINFESPRLFLRSESPAIIF